jgi:molybdate transport system ATP-binding protein
VAALDAVGDRVRVRVAASPPVVAEVTVAAVNDLALAEGTAVWMAVKATHIDVYPV